MTLFGVGKLIFGETLLGSALLGIAAAAGAVLYRDLSRRGWRTSAGVAGILPRRGGQLRTIEDEAEERGGSNPPPATNPN